MKLDSGSDLKHLKVDGGMTNGDLAMGVLADVGGFTVVRPEMREYVNVDTKGITRTLTSLARSTALGSALCAGAAIKLFGWDLNKPETLREVNVKGSVEFPPRLGDAEREKRWKGWQKAVERSRGWEEGVDEAA
jgi:glycerol kinase